MLSVVCSSAKIAPELLHFVGKLVLVSFALLGKAFAETFGKQRKQKFALALQPLLEPLLPAGSGGGVGHIAGADLRCISSHGERPTWSRHLGIACASSGIARFVFFVCPHLPALIY